MRKRIERGFMAITALIMLLTAVVPAAQASDAPASETILSKRYYYEQLSTWEKAVYDAILHSELGQGPTTQPVNIQFSALSDTERTASVEFTVVRTNEDDGQCYQSNDPLWRSLCALIDDHPELSWLRNTWNHGEISYDESSSFGLPDFFRQMAIGETRTFVAPVRLSGASFRLTDEGYAMATTSCDSVSSENRFRYADTGNLATIEAAIAQVKHEIGDLTDEPDWKKVQAVHDWILDNVDYTDENGERFLHSWRGYQTAYSALVDRETICSGFQAAFQLLCEEYGVPCVSVYGDVSTATRPTSDYDAHTWSNVLIDSTWYGVDCTSGENYRNNGGTGYEQFLKGSCCFPHEAETLPGRPSMIYPTLSSADYVPPATTAEVGDFTIQVADGADVDTVRTFAHTLAERREKIVRALGTDGIIPFGTAISVYDDAIPDDEEYSFEEIRIFNPDSGAGVLWGKVRYSGDIVMMLPDDPELTAGVLAEAADVYTRFVLNRHEIRSNSNYWYSWVRDGLVRCVDGLPADADIIRADLAGDRVPRPFVIDQIQDRARRDAYAETGVCFIRDVYGPDKVALLAKCDGNYEEALGAAHEEIADAWAQYVNDLYGNESTPAVTDNRTIAEFGTTCAQIISTLSEASCDEAQVVDAQGTAVSLDSPAATGMKVIVGTTDGAKSNLLLIVRGDVLGTGRMSLSQLVTLCRAFTGAIDLGDYAAAGDWSGDGDISLVDVVMAAQALTT